MKHIDVAYAIMRRNFSDKRDFFLKNFDELIQHSGSRIITNSVDELTKELITQYEQSHPQIRVISRNDIKNTPKITVMNRTDTDEIKGMKR